MVAIMAITRNVSAQLSYFYPSISPKRLSANPLTWKCDSAFRTIFSSPPTIVQSEPLFMKKCPSLTGMWRKMTGVINKSENTVIKPTQWV
jgi:hypothetical protein